MNNENLLIAIKDLILQVNELIRIQNNQGAMLNGLMNKGLIFEKKVSKFAVSSGAIYVPKRLIGQTFKVILVPSEDKYEQLDNCPKRASKNYGNPIAEIAEPVEKKENDRKPLIGTSY
jgi:putative transposon-encoded protein